MKIRYSELDIGFLDLLFDDGDILLFPHLIFPRPSWFVARLTRSIYAHCGIVKKEDGDIFVYETKEGKGARKLRIEQYLKKRPVDVFRLKKGLNLPQWDYTPLSDNAAKQAKSLLESNKRYGWSLFARLTLRFVPLVRLLLSPKLQDDLESKWLVCSSLITRAYRKAGVDLIPNLADCRCTPADIARSFALEKVCEFYL